VGPLVVGTIITNPTFKKYRIMMLFFLGLGAIA